MLDVHDGRVWDSCANVIFLILQSTSSKFFLLLCHGLSHISDTGGEIKYGHDVNDRERIIRLTRSFFFKQGTSPELPAFQAPSQREHKVLSNLSTYFFEVIWSNNFTVSSRSMVLTTPKLPSESIRGWQFREEKKKKNEN